MIQKCPQCGSSNAIEYKDDITPPYVKAAATMNCSRELLPASALPSGKKRDLVLTKPEEKPERGNNYA